MADPTSPEDDDAPESDEGTAEDAPGETATGAESGEPDQTPDVDAEDGGAAGADEASENAGSTGDSGDGGTGSGDDGMDSEDATDSDDGVDQDEEVDPDHGGESDGDPGETSEEDGEEWTDSEEMARQSWGGDPAEEMDDPEPGVGGEGAGPYADQEMPLTAHIEEMVKRLAVVIAVAGVVSVVTFPVAEPIINFLWNSILPPDTAGELSRPRLYGVLELWFTKVKVASLAGLIVALPVMVYQTYRFMRPGLYPHERRYYLAAVPTSLVLAVVGVAFAYFIVLPAIFQYFLDYSRGVASIGFSLGRTFNLILIMMGYLAVVFQIPLFLMLGMMMNLVTREWLADRRLLFWGSFLGISFLFSPDPTGMVPIVVAATMVGLFEGTLLLTKWSQRRGGGGESGVTG
jgi:sec-independent protein translocase protein TatC